MGKKDTEKLLQITMNFLEGLTEKQFQQLVDGRAFIRLVSGADEKTDHQEFMKLLKTDQQMEKRLTKRTKKELVSFCHHYKLDIKSRDTKKVVIEKIVESINSDGSPQKSADWEQIEKELHNSSTMDEAKTLLENHNPIRLKKDLEAFAKSIGIYVDKRYTKQELVERIADSVVGSKIRGRVIRQEE